MSIAWLLVGGGVGCSVIDEDTIAATPASDVVTRATVTWTTDVPSGAEVEYGETDAYGRTTPIVADATTSHSVTLLGVTAGTTWHYRVVANPGDAQSVSEDHTFTTEGLPDLLPPLAVDTTDRDALWGDYTLFTWFDAVHGRSTVYVIDRDGAVAWYEQANGICLSAAFSADGRAVLMLIAPPDGEDVSAIESIPLDGSARTSVAVPAAHHDFLELPDGRGYAYIDHEARDVDGEAVAGDRLVEVSLDGVSHAVWNAFDALPVVPNDGWSENPADWTHANGIAYDPDTGLYLLSLYRLSQVLAIDGATGETVWTLGLGGDFTFVGDAGFSPQHAPAWVDGQVLLFDNAYASDASRLVQYAIDRAAGTATLTWALPSPTGAHTIITGAGERLPGGGSMSGWGEAGEVLAVREDGVVARKVVVEQDGVVGSLDVTDSLYPSDGAASSEP